MPQDIKRCSITNLTQIQPQTPPLARLDAQSTYLVAGGLGGLGRAMIRFLTTLGAKHFITLSRTGADSSSKKAFVQEMKNAGVNLIVHQGSVVNIKDIKRVKELAGPYPVRGIIQGAMALQVTLPPAGGY